MTPEESGAAERPDLAQVLACLERVLQHGFGEVTIVVHAHKIATIGERISLRPPHKQED